MSKKKNRFYTVYFIDEKRSERFYSWAETARAIRGRPNLYHGFNSEEDAEAWLAGITQQDIARAILYSPPKAETPPEPSADEKGLDFPEAPCSNVLPEIDEDTDTNDDPVPESLNCTPPDVVNQEKCRQAFDNLQQELTSWGEAQCEERDVGQNLDQPVFYCLSKDAVGALMNQTTKRGVPIWEKTLLTLEEAAAYTGLGVNKVRELSNVKGCPFLVMNGTKRMIKREKFEQYLNGSSCV